MSGHFNELTPAQAERLAVLMEEMAEAQQIIGKILRHGLDSYNPFDRERHANRYLLAVEMGHVAHALDRCLGAGDLMQHVIDDAKQKKAVSILKYLHHQGGNSRSGRTEK